MKQQNNTAATSGTVLTPEERAQVWSDAMRERISKMPTCQAYGNDIIPFHLIEEAEGKPIAEVAVALLRSKRGLNAGSHGLEETFNRELDEKIERECSRRKMLNWHKSNALLALGIVTDNISRLEGDALGAFFRKYYRKGDNGTQAAVRRALAFAVSAA